MALTSLFLDMENKNVLIIGTGSVGVRRARRFLKSDANVKIITKEIDDEIKNEFLLKGATFHSNSELDELIDKCDLVVVATNDLEFNEEIAIKAKDKLVNCSSNISLSNVIVPSTFDIGSVTVSLYTGSKSPLMAKTLRKKIQSIITDEDIMYIELQEYIRDLLKIHVKSQKERKEHMVNFNNDEKIKRFIENKELDNAKSYVKTIIEKI